MSSNDKTLQWMKFFKYYDDGMNNPVPEEREFVAYSRFSEALIVSQMLDPNRPRPIGYVIALKNSRWVRDYTP